MCTPDMAGPIRWALTTGEHDEAVAPALDPLQLTKLEFAPVDADRFPFVELGFEVIRKGGGAAVSSTRPTKCACRRSWKGVFPISTSTISWLPRLIGSATTTPAT